jgi:glycosyltransferase involved in cell wall biosynthesis
MKRHEQRKGPFWRRLFSRLNMFACQSISRWQDSRISENFIVVISRFVGDVFQRVYQSSHDEVLFPPPAALHAQEKIEKRKAVLAVGRIARVKKWTELVSLLDQVRARGFDVGLTIVGFVEDADYHAELLRLGEKRDWFRLRANASREELTTEIAEHEFGIHIMPGEHYGMAVAEMLLGGCLTLVHDSGGQVEIVTEPELRFADTQDAVQKLSRLLGSPQERERLKAAQRKRCQAYSLEAFRDSFHRCMDTYEAWSDRTT